MSTFILTLVYVALVYLRPQEYVASLKDAPILAITLAAAGVAWIFTANKRVDTPQHPILIAFTVLLGLSVAASGWLGGAVPAMLDFLPGVVLFFLVATSTSSPGRHYAFMVLLGLCSTVMAVHGIDQAAHGTGWSGATLSEGSRITYVGIFNDPNDLALAFVMAIPMIGYCMAHTRSRLLKAAWAASFATVVYGVYLTNSRGGMLAALALGLVYATRRFGTALGICAAGLGLAAISLLPSRLDKLDADEESAAGRVDAWYAGLDMLLHHPILGVGKGNFVEHNSLTAHNSLVLVAAETGLAGYYLWLCFVGLSFYMVYRLARAPAQEGAPDDPVRPIARTYCYSMLGFFVAAFFLSRSYVILLYLLCGLCVALFQCARASEPPAEAVRLGPVAGRFLALEIGSIGFLFALVKVLL